MSLNAPAAEMVGRDAELERLITALERARAGESASVLVAGEAGIGKSRLLREFRDAVGDQAAVLTGWCLDYGSTPAPYGPVPAILRGLLAELGAEAADAAGPGRDALGLLLPELGGAPVDRTVTGPEGLREAIANLFEAAAARTPVVVLIEDLHWADAATLSLLSFLLRVLAGRPVLFVLTCRIDDVRRGGAVRRFLVEAERARLLDRLALQRLGRAAVRRLLQALSGPVDEAALQRLLERSEGVPFFVEELACNAQGPIPDSLRDLLLARFDLLSDDAKRVVRTVSGSDGAVPHALLASLAGFDDERLDEAVREATTAAVLAVRGDDSYGFRHALLREAVHDDLLPGERARLHRAYGEALEAIAAETAVSLAPALAFHWHQAHDARRALIAAVEAMMQAKASYAFSTAARFGELALELWDQVPDAAEAVGLERITLLARLGSILRNAGDGERSLAVVNLALDEADPSATDPAVYVRLLRDKAHYLQNLGRPGPIELFSQALQEMEGRVDDDRLRATLLNHLTGRLMITARVTEGLERADEAAALAERCGLEGPLSVAFNLRGTMRVQIGRVDEGMADFRSSWEHAVDSDARLRYWVNYSDILALLGRYREAVEIAEAGVEHARSLGVGRSTGSLLAHNMIEPLIDLGEIARAEEIQEKDVSFRTLHLNRVYATMSRIRLLAWRGRIADAEALLAEWRATIESISRLESQTWYSHRAIELAIAIGGGDFARAVEAARLVVADEGPSHAHRRRPLLDAAWAVAQLRDCEDDQAAELAGELRSAWERMPEELCGTARVVSLALAFPDPARLREAVHAADEGEVPAIYRVIARIELARVLAAERGRPERAEAAAVLSEAADLVDALGHVGLAREVADLGAASGLLGAGSGGRESEAGGGAELTARERQVLELIAEGLSNRQIGERLFISVKTASVHVSAILRKLGVSSRTEAAVAAARLTADAR
ncbi:helix-turn-helix transcriptional regulator [Microbacterium resistens]|uniref:helix-turn-helix transcriptional regulator n=1 Tax=Microbacterium resistens TaxID=156977 RepID=UPI0008340383|nr:LuxR family transcriptional regulator [Microbacterium resistens]